MKSTEIERPIVITVFKYLAVVAGMCGTIWLIETGMAFVSRGSNIDSKLITTACLFACCLLCWGSASALTLLWHIAKSKG